MLKNTLLLGILCFCFNIANGQTLQSVQLAGGINYSNMNWSIQNSNIFNEYIVTKNAALSFNFIDHKIWSLNTAIKYIEMGGGQQVYFSDEMPPNAGDPQLFEHRMEYISFSPRLAAQKTFNNLGIIAKAGPSISYLLNIDIEDLNYNTLNYGADFGLEFRYQFSNNLFVSLESMYYLHLNEIYGNDMVSIKNGNNIGALIGIGYNL